MATGRKPNSEGLGLKALGIDDSSALSVDPCMRLPNPGLYAVGDVTGLGFLDSTAFSQANLVINAILGKEGRFDPRGIPRCIHTEPAIAVRLRMPIEEFCEIPMTQPSAADALMNALRKL